MFVAAETKPLSEDEDDTGLRQEDNNLLEDSDGNDFDFDDKPVSSEFMFACTSNSNKRMKSTGGRPGNPNHNVSINVNDIPISCLFQCLSRTKDAP